MHRWVEHTGELELEIEAPHELGVFEEGFEAMRELLAVDDGEALEPRRVRLTAADRPALLADWLAELAFLAETDGFVVERLDDLTLTEDGLAAVVAGVHGTPPHLVKAATYHRLALGRDGDVWRATVVLDV